MAAAWYLAKPVGDSANFVDISIPAPVAIAGEYDFTIGFEVQLTATDLPVIHASALDTTVHFYFVNSSGNLDIRTSGNTTTITVNGGDKTQWNKYRVRHYTSGGVNYRQVYYNDVLKNTYTINNIPTEPIAYLFKVGNSTRTGNLKTLWFEDVNAPANNKLYDANLSGGVGTTLPPDGTLQGALSWVEYDDGTGGATDYDLDPEAGIFSYSGGSVQLLINRILEPQSGVYGYSGGAVSLTINRAILPGYGVYSYAGGSVTLAVDRAINPEAGVFSYTGGAAGIVYDADTSISIAPEAGEFSYSGGAVTLKINRAMTPEAGVFSSAGGAVEITTGKSLTPESGIFNYTGVSVELILTRAITPEPGVFNFTGSAVTITYSGQVIRRVSNYSVNYEQDFFSVNYQQVFYSANYEPDYYVVDYEGIQ